MGGLGWLGRPAGRPAEPAGMLAGMRMTVARLDGPVRFLSAGRFVSGPGWRHMRRTIDNHELVFVRRGVLPVTVGGSELELAAGDVALWPPQVEHAGSRNITEYLEFYWMHFHPGRVRALDAADASAVPQDEHCLLLPAAAHLDDSGRLAVLVGQLLDAYVQHGPHANVYCDFAATCALLEVSAQLRAGLDAARRGAGESGADSAVAREPGLAVMQGVRSWIRANACEDGINVASVAERFHYSPSYLTALYKRVYGVGVVEQIAECRIDRARELLSSTSAPVADIAAEVGYADPKYFLRVFKRRTGLTPSQYRATFPGKLFNTQ